MRNFCCLWQQMLNEKLEIVYYFCQRQKLHCEATSLCIAQLHCIATSLGRISLPLFYKQLNLFLTQVSPFAAGEASIKLDAAECDALESHNPIIL